jgi:hypothetical protein
LAVKELEVAQRKDGSFNPLSCVLVEQGDTVRLIDIGPPRRHLGDFLYPDAFWPTPKSGLLASIRPYVLTALKDGRV